MINDQDNQLDEVIGVVKATKYEAQDFNTEIKGQNKRIEKLGEDIDKAEWSERLQWYLYRFHDKYVGQEEEKK